MLMDNTQGRMSKWQAEWSAHLGNISKRYIAGVHETKKKETLRTYEKDMMKFDKGNNMHLKQRLVKLYIN